MIHQAKPKQGPKLNPQSKLSLRLVSILSLICFLLCIESTQAAPKPPSERSKVIDFDGDLVEGMNKRPFDSLNQVSEAQKKRKGAHLYRKRKGFRSEIRATLREMRYAQ